MTLPPPSEKAMSNGSELKSPGAQALRAAGYKPAPRVWLTDEQIDLLMYMAKQNESEVNRIRAASRTTLTKEQEIELAWMRIGKANT
jgi:hypothetical protein